MQRSDIPTSCNQTETSVIPQSVKTLWPKFRTFAFAELAPTIFKSTVLEPSCCSGQVGAVVTLTYQDGAQWKISVTEISDKNFTVGYEVLEANPTLNVTGVQGEIKLQSVTDSD